MYQNIVKMDDSLRKKFRCGICFDFFTDNVPDLQAHSEARHSCDLCGRDFFNKEFHSCTFGEEGNEQETFQIGYGEPPQVPLDQNNQPIFRDGGSTFGDVIKKVLFDYKNLEFVSILEGTELIRKPLESFINSYMVVHKGLRLKLAFFILFYSPKENKDVQKRYSSVPFRVTHRNFISSRITDCANYVDETCEILSEQISGLLIRKLLTCEITLLKLQVHTVRGYLPMCKELARKRGVLNVKSHDDMCVLYSVVCCLHYKTILNSEGKNIDSAKGSAKKALRRQLERQKTWKPFVSEIKLADCKFDTDFENLADFEFSNDVSISILKYSRKAGSIIPYRLTKLFLKNRVFLLLISRHQLEEKVRNKFKSEYHTVSVLDINALMAVKSKKYNYVCRFCFCFTNDHEHETKCFNNCLTNLTMPSTKFYRFNEHYKLCLPPTFFVYSFLYSGNPTDVKIIGFCLLVVSSNFEILHNRTYMGDSAVNVFLDEVIMNAYFYLKLNEENHIPLRATPRHIEEMQKQTHCYVCGEEATATNKLVPNHDHHSRLIYGEEVPGHKPGMPFSYCHQMCNILMRPRKRIPVYGYNLSYHSRFILKSLSDRGLKSVSVIPIKNADNVGSLIVNNRVQFLDLANHWNNESLHSIFKSVDSNDLQYIKLLAKDEKDFSLMQKGFPFPSFVETMPCFENFEDVRYLNGFTKDDYNHCIESYHHFKCENLNDYGKLCLETDAYGLLSLVVAYAKFCMSSFQLNPCWDISISGYSYSVLHYYSKTKYANLDDMRIIKILQKSMLPGLSVSNVKRADFKSKRLGDDVETELNSEAFMVDIRSQYASILLKPMPFDSYMYWDAEDVAKFKLDKIDDYSDIRYIIRCSLNYPDEIHDFSQSLPFGYSRLTENADDNSMHTKEMFFLEHYGSKLSALDLTCENKKNIWLSGKLLMLFLSLGMQLVSITEIISYRVTDHLASFARRCIELRKSVKNSPFFEHIAKAIPNLAVGKFQQKSDCLKTVITTSKKQTEKYLSKRLFVDASPLEPNLGLIVMKRKKSLPLKNFLISWQILMESVYQMYHFFYYEVKRVWGPRAYLLYGQVDSMIIRLEQVDNFEGDLEKLKHVLDLTTVPKSASFYDEHQKETEGKWKLEAFRIRQFLSLRRYPTL